MATVAQTTANRVNSQLSTGPRTSDGKAASCLNALKHGLTAAQIVIPGEDSEAYEELSQSLIGAYRPANEVEAMLVEAVAQNWWKLQRAQRIEAKIMAELGEEACFLDDKAAKKWNNFLRYRNSIDRAWKFAVNELKRLVTARQKRDAAIAASATFIESLTASNGSHVTPSAAPHPRPQLNLPGPLQSDRQSAAASA